MSLLSYFSSFFTLSLSDDIEIKKKAFLQISRYFYKYSTLSNETGGVQ